MQHIVTYYKQLERPDNMPDMELKQFDYAHLSEVWICRTNRCMKPGHLSELMNRNYHVSEGTFIKLKKILNIPVDLKMQVHYIFFKVINKQESAALQIPYSYIKKTGGRPVFLKIIYPDYFPTTLY